MSPYNHYVTQAERIQEMEDALLTINRATQMYSNDIEALKDVTRTQLDVIALYLEELKGGGTIGS